MAPGFSNLLRWQSWRSGLAFLNAIRAFRRGDDQSALANFDRVISLDVLRTAEHMDFYATLLTLNKRPVDEVIEIYKKIVAGEFRSGRRNSKYAQAYAQYWLAYLTGRHDLFARWSEAYGLRPKKGFAARYLPLPANPVLS